MRPPLLSIRSQTLNNLFILIHLILILKTGEHETEVATVNEPVGEDGVGPGGGWRVEEVGE